MNGKRLVAYRYSLGGACFAKYRFLNLHSLHFHCFIPCLALKVIIAGADPGFFSGGGAPLRNDVTDSEVKKF